MKYLKYHWARRFYHFLWGCAVLWGSSRLPDRALDALLLIAFTVVTWGCQSTGWVHRVYLRIASQVLRPDERKHVFPGSFWFLLSSIICHIAFDRHIFQLAVLGLAVGDPVSGIAAAFVSNSQGGVPRREKSIFSFLACALASAAAFQLWMFALTPVTAAALGFSVLSGAFVAVAELLLFSVDIPRQGSMAVDDNLSMPLVSALLWQLGRGLAIRWLRVVGDESRLARHFAALA